MKKMSRPNFIVDAMLGSLARKLRIFGFDTSYFKAGEDGDLLRVASEEERAIVTSDRALGETARRRGLLAFIVVGRKDRDRIVSLVEQAERLHCRLEGGDPLCALCNGSLYEAKRENVRGLLPSKIVAKHRAYYICRECGKVYWHGSHWSRLRRIELLLETSERI